MQTLNFREESPDRRKTGDGAQAPASKSASVAVVCSHTQPQTSSEATGLERNRDE
ncbi:hypothetical protein M1615_04220 [Patescibacteria group bacterium]|nr:hypothetical protein [Patescibacteria group bacterium]